MNAIAAATTPPGGRNRGRGAFFAPGFALIEILLALFVMAVMMLAVVTIQVNAKKASFEAVQRSTANYLAHGILERMRANRSSLFTYLTDDNGVGDGGGGSEPAPSCRDPGTTCTWSQLATYDMWSWAEEINGASEKTNGNSVGGLVEPLGCITAGAGGAAAGNYVVTIAWRGKEPTSNPTSSPCGQASGKYGDNNEYRRVVVVDTLIALE